jgi:RecJ-like exonuclease
MAQELAVIAFVVDADGDEPLCSTCDGYGVLECECTNEPHEDHVCPECAGKINATPIASLEQVATSVPLLDRRDATDRILFAVASLEDVERRIAFDASVDAFVVLDVLRQMDEAVLERLFPPRQAA